MFEQPADIHASPVVLAEVKKLIEDCIAPRGVHVIEVEMRGEGEGKALEVYIDSETGITTEVCSDVSREIDRVLDSAGPVRESYRLTVSSPGIARPLKYLWQYRKHVGRPLKLTVRSDNGTRSVMGKLLSIEDAGIVIAAGRGPGQEAIAFDTIEEARVQAPW